MKCVDDQFDVEHHYNPKFLLPLPARKANFLKTEVNLIDFGWVNPDGSGKDANSWSPRGSCRLDVFQFLVCIAIRPQNRRTWSFHPESLTSDLPLDLMWPARGRPELRILSIPAELCPEMVSGVPQDFDDPNSVSKYYRDPTRHVLGKEYEFPGFLQAMMSCNKTCLSADSDSKGHPGGESIPPRPGKTNVLSEMIHREARRLMWGSLHPTISSHSIFQHSSKNFRHSPPCLGFTETCTHCWYFGLTQDELGYVFPISDWRIGCLDAFNQTFCDSADLTYPGDSMSGEACEVLIPYGNLESKEELKEVLDLLKRRIPGGEDSPSVSLLFVLQSRPHLSFISIHPSTQCFLNTFPSLLAVCFDQYLRRARSHSFPRS